MTEKMMAVVVHAGDEFALEAVDRPTAGPGEVIVKIEAAGICAADRKIYDKNHPWQLPDPYFPGHEYVGRVVELGEGAAERTGLVPDDRAIVSQVCNLDRLARLPERFTAKSPLSLQGQSNPQTDRREEQGALKLDRHIVRTRAPAVLSPDFHARACKLGRDAVDEEPPRAAKLRP